MLKYFFKSKPSPSKNGYEFKMQHSFDKRKEESSRLIKKFPNKIPIILEKSDSSALPRINKQKFLLPKDITIGQFIYIIRSKIKLDASQSIFIFINNYVIPSTNQTIGDVYIDHADKDGYLYITYSAEQTFG